MTLADLFDGKSQLIIYHFMFGPDWQEGCPSCSFNMDHTDSTLVHLAQRDVSFAAISRAPYPKIASFKKRMGWRFNWVSSNGNDFNRDYHVAFTKEELAKGEVDYNFGMNKFPSEEAPGISVFWFVFPHGLGTPPRPLRRRPTGGCRQAVLACGRCARTLNIRAHLKPAHGLSLRR